MCGLPVLPGDNELIRLCDATVSLPDTYNAGILPIEILPVSVR